MCGIVGYIGNKKAAPILLEGLKRLEYRGYDSAGLAVVTQEKIVGVKKPGRINILENEVQNYNLDSSLGIAHTRWATHGAPTEKNAHPHFDCSGKIAVVHNGIIENYAEVRRGLENAGHQFKSETDTEVLAHLIEKYYQENLAEAVRQALKHVRGTYGLAVVAADQPNLVVAARMGSPLILGIGKDEYFLASDTAAILPHTNQVIYPADGELIRVSRQGFSTLTLDNQIINKKIETLSLDTTSIEKGLFPHYMLKEIYEQPQVVKNCLTGRLILGEGAAHVGGLNLTEAEIRMVERVVFVACGTASYAGMVGKYFFEEIAGVPCDVCMASEFRYNRLLLSPQTIVFVVSQSGETADTIAAMREVRKKGIKVLGVINVVGSTISRETDGGMFIYAGPEIGVASTKAFMGQITALALIALKFGRLRNLSSSEGKTIAQGLFKIPTKVEEILEQAEKIKQISLKYKDYNNFLYLGRKASFPIALEGALKLKEISYIHAEGYPGGEMKHGPIALIDENFPSVFIAPRDDVYEKTISNMEEIRARKGKIVAIATAGDEEISKHADDTIFVPQIENVLSPFLTVIPLQLLAYFIAAARGCDVDKPRNLAKSVTVE
jgi:glucosamine--fructose-6-phosphate aminotransferase (isomerizing)